ncbi:MAG: hypothetical protein LIO78_02165, partial [Clostridiales bacterium]|nr:hypothetical protein [Clostridiales bacterium]
RRSEFAAFRKYASGIFLAENRSQLRWQGSLTEKDMLKVIARKSDPRFPGKGRPDKISTANII